MTSQLSAPPTLAQLSSATLTARLGELLADERKCLLQFLWHLAELDRRRGYLDLGYPSLFAYCVEGLRLSNASAFRRTTAARLMSRFPVVAEYLADGRLGLGSLAALRDVLEPGNHQDLLQRAAGRTEDEVKLLVAQLRPRPDVQDSIRRVTPRPAPALFAAAAPPRLEASATAVPSVAVCVVETTSAAPLPRPPPPPRLEPLDGARYSLRISVGKEFIDELERVKAALSHVVPDGKLEHVLLECMRRTREACSRRRGGAPRTATTSEVRAAEVRSDVARSNATSGPEVAQTTPPGDATSSSSGSEGCCSPTTLQVSPCAGPGSLSRAAAMEETSGTFGPELRPARSATSIAPTSGPEVDGQGALDLGGDHRDDPQQRRRYVPAAVRRAVWDRDQGRCTYRAPDGRRCGSTRQLELHHLTAFALGGPSTVEGLTLYCRAHNQHAARLDFGEEHMARFTGG